MNMNAVGIDVSKGGSMITILQPYGEIVPSPSEIKHTSNNIRSLAEQTRSIEGESRTIVEHTDRYYGPPAHKLSLAGLSITAVNPKLTKDLGAHSLRGVESDKVDAIKVTRYTLNNQTELKQYGPMDGLRSRLKIMNHQFDFYMKHRTAMKNNLTGILDQTYPSVNTYFDSPTREDGGQKWVNPVTTYWYVDYVRKFSLNTFVDHYQKRCKRRKYNSSKDKARKIYGAAREPILILPKGDLTRLIVKQSVEQLNTTSKAVGELRILTNDATIKLPEYLVIMGMKGTGLSPGPQLMAEIGDVTCSTHKEAIIAFAGVGPGINESGAYERKGVPTSRRGPSSLQGTLSQVIDRLIKTKLQDDPIYAFINKRRAQGEPCYVYMTAGTNKFLRIHYGRVEEYLISLPE